MSPNKMAVYGRVPHSSFVLGAYNSPAMVGKKCNSSVGALYVHPSVFGVVALPCLRCSRELSRTFLHVSSTVGAFEARQSGPRCPRSCAVPYETGWCEAEEVGVEHLLRDIKNAWPGRNRISWITWITAFCKVDISYDMSKGYKRIEKSIKDHQGRSCHHFNIFIIFQDISTYFNMLRGCSWATKNFPGQPRPWRFGWATRLVPWRALPWDSGRFPNIWAKWWPESFPWTRRVTVYVTVVVGENAGYPKINKNEKHPIVDDVDSSWFPCFFSCGRSFNMFKR